MRKVLAIRLLIVTSLILVLANVAHAAEGQSRHAFTGAREIRVTEDARFAGMNLPVGTYRMTWTLKGEADRVEVQMLKGKRLLVAATGRAVAQDWVSPYDSVVYTRDASGKLQTAEIHFEQSRLAILLAGATLDTHQATQPAPGGPEGSEEVALRFSDEMDSVRP